MANLDWFDFKNPDYDRVFNERISNLKRLKANPSLIAPLKEYYKNNPIDFICDWAVTADPRNAEIGLPVIIPFILFQRQKEYITWVIDRWKAREDGLAEKSRDMGVTWLCIAIAVWMWLFYDGVVIGFGSRKEEYVDKIGDPKSIFDKLRQFIRYLPTELKPKGFSVSKHCPYMRILNPENGSSIVGEAGDNIGRGNRTSIYFKDESAFYEHPEAIDASLSQTSNCKIDVSTPNGNGNPFYQKRQKGKIPIFSFHWTQDPRKDEVWYRKQQEKLDPVIVAQEIDIDYNASVSDAWIVGDTIEQAQSTGVADVEATGQWIIGIDAAHFGDDESVIHMRRGRLNLPQKTYRQVDGQQLAALVTEMIDSHTNGENIFGIVIELDGAGVSCHDHLKNGKYSKFVYGVHTGARTSDDKNYNLRAKMWRAAKDYLLSPPVSLPRDFELKSQLGSIKYKYKDGVLLMQDKKEYKKLFGKSPDRADAFVLTFAIQEVAPRQKKHVYHQQNGWMG